MYVVRVMLQATALAALISVFLAMLVSAFLANETPIRAALGIASETAPLVDAIRLLDEKVSIVSARIDMVTGAIGEPPRNHQHSHGDTIAFQIDRIEHALARIETRLLFVVKLRGDAAAAARPSAAGAPAAAALPAAGGIPAADTALPAAAASPAP